MTGGHVVVTELQQCLAPGCPVMYRPNWTRRGGACSGRCSDVLQAMIARGETVRHPSWVKVKK